MKICFVDSIKFEYSFEDINNQKIRGAESILINLSKTLSLNGLDIMVFTNCEKENSQKNYSWLRLNRIDGFKNNFDIVISNNDTQILDKFNCKKKFVISHSIQSIEKALRKKQLFSYFRNKPKYLLLGNYHKSQMSKIFSIYGTDIIDYGVDNIFETTKISNFKDNKLSFFTSRQDRNLDILVEVWKENIFNKDLKYKLFVTPIKKNLEQFNIFNRDMLNKDAFVKQISGCRMIILPGHKAELYCLSALEAAELCLPVVTMGIGSLSERVEHNITGLISKNKHDFARDILEMYNNDDMWNELRNNLISRRGQNSWAKAAKNFFKIISNDK